MCPFCLMTVLTAAASITTGGFTAFAATCLRRCKRVRIPQAISCKSEDDHERTHRFPR